MSGFISALIKQRKEAKKAEPSSNKRLKEIIDVVRKYNYDDGITPEQKGAARSATPNSLYPKPTTGSRLRA